MPLYIDVNQKKISIGDKYTIAINGQPYFKAAAKLFKIFPCIEVSPLSTPEQVVMRIEAGWAFLKPKYTFTYRGMQYALETISWWKRRYVLNAGPDRFEIVGHKGRKVSIFHNNRQVAWFDNEAVTFFSGDNYHLTANADAPVDWLIAIVLFWDSFFNRDQKGAVNFKFGSLVESQSFDKGWQAV